MCGVQIDADNKVTVIRERKSSNNHVGHVAELGYSVLLVYYLREWYFHAEVMLTFLIC